MELNGENCRYMIRGIIQIVHLLYLTCECDCVCVQHLILIFIVVLGARMHWNFSRRPEKIESPNSETCRFAAIGNIQWIQLVSGAHATGNLVSGICSECTGSIRISRRRTVCAPL